MSECDTQINGLTVEVCWCVRETIGLTVGVGCASVCYIEYKTL